MSSVLFVGDFTMKKIIAASAAFLTMAFFAMSASAVTTTWLNNGGIYSIGVGNTYAGNVTTGTGSWAVRFDATSALSGTTTASIGGVNLGNYSNLVMSWVSAATNTVLSSVAITSGQNLLSTVFSSPGNLSQYLRFTWSSSGSSGGFDVKVHDVAAVPLPAGFLLMGTALAGLGVISRRRKKKLAA